MTPSCRRVALLAAVPALVLLTTLSACTSKSIGSNDKSPIAGGSQGAPDGSQTSTAPVTTAPVLPKAVITATPAAGTSVSPVQPVTVAVTDGKLTSVKLLNPEGKAVTGALAADGTSWKSTEELGYSKTYSLSAVAVDADGKPTTKKTHFTTLTPANMTMPYLNTTGGQTLVNGETYGVGIVPVVHFDEAVTDKKAAEKALVVRTSPHVSGIWNWVSDTDAHAAHARHVNAPRFAGGFHRVNESRIGQFIQRHVRQRGGGAHRQAQPGGARGRRHTHARV